MKRLKFVICIFCGVFFLLMAGRVSAATNTSMKNAAPVSLTKTASGNFEGIYDEEYWYKLSIPSDIGNKWIDISMTSYASEPLELSLCNAGGGKVDSLIVTNGETAAFHTRTSGAASNDKSLLRLSAGAVYYLSVKPSWSHNRPKGTFSISSACLSDDSWGTLDKAVGLVKNKVNTGKIERSDDVDTFTITLPNDGKSYLFNFTSTNMIDIMVTDGNGIRLDNISVFSSQSEVYTFIGKGQKLLFSVSLVTPASGTAVYTIKGDFPVVKKKIKTLKLTQCKKGTKKIAGKTLKKATVTITIGKQKYKTSANGKGNFSVKLKKKLSKNTSVNVTVTKTGYAALTKVFVMSVK